MFVSVSMWLKFFGHVKIFDTKYLFVRKVKVMWRGSGKQVQKNIQVQIQIYNKCGEIACRSLET